jgi:hypothetical protein
MPPFSECWLSRDLTKLLPRLTSKHDPFALLALYVAGTIGIHTALPRLRDFSFFKFYLKNKIYLNK